MVAYKGRTFLRQYMPAKGTKWGFKIFAGCDATSGYAFLLDPYLGKRPGEPPTKDLGAKIVLKLVAHLPPNTVVFADRYFSGVQLVKTLLEQHGMLYCGTVMTNRKFINRAALVLPKKSKRGASVGAVCTKTDIKMVTWLDSKPVTMVSTIGSPYIKDPCIRRGKNADGVSDYIPLERPQIISLYNKYMGGVDHNDQLRATYPMEGAVISRKWYIILYLGQQAHLCASAHAHGNDLHNIIQPHT